MDTARRTKDSAGVVTLAIFTCQQSQFAADRLLRNQRLTPVLIDPRPRNRLYSANVTIATIGRRGQIDFVTISSPWRKLWRNRPQSIYKCTAYLSAEAPLMALQKMPIGSFGAA